MLIMGHQRLFEVALGITLGLILCVNIPVYAVDSGIYAEEVRLEKIFEERIKSTLDTMLGPNNSVTAVDFTLGERAGKLLDRDEANVLPGVPDISMPEKPKSEYYVKQIVVSVGVPETISDKLLQQVQSTVIELVGLQSSRGDKLSIRKMQFVKDEQKELYRIERFTEKGEGGAQNLNLQMPNQEDKKKGKEEVEQQVDARAEIILKQKLEEKSIANLDDLIEEVSKYRNIFNIVLLVLGTIIAILLVTIAFLLLSFLRRTSTQTFSYLNSLLEKKYSVPEEIVEEIPVEEIPSIEEKSDETNQEGLAGEQVDATAPPAIDPLTGEPIVSVETTVAGETVLPESTNSTETTEGGESMPEDTTPKPFDFAIKADKAQLANILMESTEEEMATVMSFMSPTEAATVIKYFPEDMQIRAITTLAQRRLLDADRIAYIEQSLYERMQFTMGGEFRVTRVVDHVDEAMSKRILASLQNDQNNQGLFQKLREQLFLFNDVQSQDNKTLQNILRNVDTSELAIAIKSSPEDFKKRVMDNLTEGAAQILQEEMEFGGAESPARIAKAQENILTVIKRMEAEGKIMLVKGTSA